MARITATDIQLEVLCNAYRTRGVTHFMAHTRTLNVMVRRGWLEFNTSTQRYTLTPDGEDVMHDNSERTRESWFLFKA